MRSLLARHSEERQAPGRWLTAGLVAWKAVFARFLWNLRPEQQELRRADPSE